MRNFNYCFVFLLLILVNACSGKKDLKLMGSTTFTIEVDVLDFLAKESNGRLSGLEAKPSSPEKMIHSILEDLKVRFSENLAQVFFFHNPKDYPQSMKVDELEKKLIEKYNQSVEQCKKVFSYRLSRFGISADEFFVQTNAKGQIIIQVYGDQEMERLSRLFHAYGNIGFFETFEVADIFNSFTIVDTFISHHRNLMHFSDTASSIDSMIQMHPLLYRLMPSLEKSANGNYYYSKGARIGYSKISDTAMINYYLGLKEVKQLLPIDLKCLWALKSEKGQSDEVISLYGIKAKNLFDTELKGSDIDEAHVENDRYSGNLSILFRFSEDAAVRWYEMTNRNQKRSIAIVMDERVISAPLVDGPISGGNSQISGQFTKSECEEISSLLGASSLPIGIRIVDVQVVKPTK